MQRKSIMKRNKKTYFFILLITFLISLAYIFSIKPSYTEVKLLVQGSKSTITLPYHIENSPLKNYIIEFKVSHGDIPLSLMHITADDCVKKILIDDQEVDMKRITKGNVCDYWKGFYLDASPYLQSQTNKMQIYIENKGGATALDIDFSRSGMILDKIAWLLQWLSLFGLIVILSLMLGLSSPLSLLFGVGILLRIAMLWHTPYQIFSHDVGGHLDYIRYIIENHSLPLSTQCWQCYQPPLYYILAAPIYMLGNYIDILDSYKNLQALSLILNSGFLLFVLLILKKVQLSSVTQVFIGSIVIFMPSMVIHSIRIGNDALLYFAYAGAFYFLVSWLKSRENLWYAVFFSVLALFAKTNGLIIMGVLGGSLLLYGYLYRGYLKKVVSILGIFIIAISISISIHVSRDKTHTIVSNASVLPQNLYVGNSIKNYVYFDLKNYIEEPFTSPWDDKKGRQYFWNYLLKTSLFGEFSFESIYLKNIGIFIGVIYLWILLTSLFGLFQFKKQDIIGYFPFLLNFFLLLMAAIYLRVTIPAACSNDFRYIVPIIISGLLFLGIAVETIKKSPYPILKMMILSSISFFSGFSILFLLYYLSVT